MLLTNHFTGGIFANGAVTGAFSRAFNEEAEKTETWDSHTNRRIKTLHEKVQGAATGFINRVEQKHGIRLRVTHALRTFDQQNKLYAIGRNESGEVIGDTVTFAKGGESYHNYGLAIDVIPINSDGSVQWNPSTTTWDEIDTIANNYGFSQIGRWDAGHNQMTFGLSISDLQNGERP